MHTEHATPPLSGPRDRRVDRPLSLGEIFDRAITALVARWSSIVPLCVLAYLPLIAIDVVPGADPSNVRIGHAVHDVLSYVVVGLCAIIIARASCGAQTSIADAVRVLSASWATVTILALAFGALSLGVAAAATLLWTSWLSYGTSHAQVFEFSALFRLSVDTVAYYIALFGYASSCSAVLEADSISDAALLALSATFGARRIGKTLLACVALALLLQLLGTANAFVAISAQVQDWPKGVVVLARFLTDFPVFAYFVVVAIYFYLDARIRQGVDVAAKFDEEIELAEGSA